MAEVVGLVLGVAGLAGCIGALKEVVDLFGLIEDGRNLDRDFEVLNIKFDIEKVLLLQWADRVKLLQSDHDRRLDDRGIQDIVVRTLHCMSQLLKGTSGIQERYSPAGPSEYYFSQESNGVTTDDSDEESDEEITTNGMRQLSISRERKMNFLRQCMDLNLRKKNHQKTPFHKRVRWAIRDKQKLDAMIREFGNLITKLNDMFPVTNQHPRLGSQNMADQDMGSVRDPEELKLILEASTGFQDTIAESARRAMILAQLWFRRIDDRRESIATEHQETFSWILEPDLEGKWEMDSFSAWLQSGSGIYWICGKAGSGKSTLMKYLTGNDRTRHLLSVWAEAHNTTCSLCHFFFMGLGTQHQKSLEGLARTLLHQILDTHRFLIPEALPNMWKEIQDTQEKPSTASPAEIKYAFQVISRTSQDIGNFCFFLDGLDEFAGNCTDGIEFIQTLVKNERIKIVVSSREIPDCVAAFSNLPRLRLQDLTQGDITKYVQDIIGQHAYMEKLIRRHPEEAATIIHDLVEKSSGVFLWVILACRSLLRGFADYDRIPELRRRVDEFPQELGDMFQYMLNKINPRHREQGARLLKICHTYAQAYRGSGGIYALGLALVEDYQPGALNIDSLDRSGKLDLCEELEGRLRSRCGGLLELSKWRSPSKYCFCGTWFANGLHSRIIDAKVDFMHRSVFEFLSRDDVWKLDCLQDSDNNFDVATALSTYGLQLTMQSLNSPQFNEQIPILLSDAMRWNIAAARRNLTQSSYFSESLQLVLSGISHLEFEDEVLSSLIRGTMHHGTELAMSHTFIPLALEAGALNYIKTHPHFPAVLAHDRTSCGCLPLLLQVVLSYSMERNKPRNPFPGLEMELYFQKTVGLLLSSGSDPNELFGTYKSPWAFWANYIGRTRLGHDGLEVLNVIEMFLDFGADVSIFDLDLKVPLTDYCLDPDVGQKFKAKAQELLCRPRGFVTTEPEFVQRKRALSDEERNVKRARTAL